jgi:uncharacterized protein (TIGR02301 family)
MRTAVLILLAVLATPAAAQQRTPADRQALTQLARTLGEAHALRIVCEGRDDQRWRNRMQRVIELEAADAALEARLHESFNTGYIAAEAAHTGCNAAAKAEVARVSRRGRDLAASLAGGRMETAAR